MSSDEEDDIVTLSLPNGDVIYSGDDFSGSPFLQVQFDGTRYIFKSINRRIGGLHRPLGLDIVDKALGLKCTTGILPAVLEIKGGKEPTYLERAVRFLPGYDTDSYYNKHHLIYDVSAGRSAGGAVSFLDLSNDRDHARVDAVSTSAFQRLGLLVILGRLGMVNCDDILLAEAPDGGLSLVYGDAKKAFWHDPTKNKNRFDEETHEFVPAGPLDQMRNVLESTRYMMAESDEWINWDKRPLTTEIANLITSWSESAIDEALGAEEVSRRTVKEALDGYRAKDKKAESAASPQGPAVGSKRSAAEIEAEKKELEEEMKALRALSGLVKEEEEEEEEEEEDEDEEEDEEAEEARLGAKLWMPRWKTTLLSLQEKIRAGGRPSMNEISDLFRPSKAA